MKRLALYVKFYLEPSGKTLRAQAFNSAKAYYTNRPFSNYYLRTIEFQTYQQNYVRAYRENYAKTKLTFN
jgi:5-formyltetrahydrofolate cyclo-ligase